MVLIENILLIKKYYESILIITIGNIYKLIISINDKKNTIK